MVAQQSACGNTGESTPSPVSLSSLHKCSSRSSSLYIYIRRLFVLSIVFFFINLSFCLFLFHCFCFSCLQSVTGVHRSFLSSPDSLSSCPFLHSSYYLLSGANATHSCILLSLISSLSHQSPSELTAATSDLSVHTSLFVLSSSWTQFPLSFSTRLSPVEETPLH